MSSSKADLFQVIAVTAIAGGGLLLRTLKNHKRLRKIADTPRSKIASAPQGLVELEGFAWPQAETFQTLDGEEAIYYVIELQREETRGSGKNKRREWITVFHHQHIFPFYLLDPTGLAQILPHNSDVNVTNKSTRHFGHLSQKAIDRIAQIVGPGIDNFPPGKSFLNLFARKYRVVEQKIVVGSPIYANGDFKTHTTNQLMIDDSLATFANKVINFEARALKNVNRLLDRDGDGVVSTSEALAGYTTAAALSRRNPQKETVPLEIFGTLDSSDNHKLFFSDTHEHHLIEHLGKWQTLKLVSGAALIAISICVGLLEFGLIPNPFDEARKAERERVQRERVALVESQKEITALHTACVNGQAGYCRQLIERKNDLQLTQQHLDYYSETGCRNGEKSLCRNPASN